MSWVPERIDQLKKLWAAGESASVIAATLGGTTRNAVIGKAHRLGLAGRRTACRRAPTSRRRSRHRARQSRPWASPAPRKAKPEKTMTAALGPAPDVIVTVETLNERLCRWPEGDPKQPGFHFCGRAKGETQGPYCAAHASIAYR